MSLFKKFQEIQKIGTTVKVPYELVCAFGSNLVLEIYGDQITFGEDSMSIEQARKALEILTEQLGGKIKWEKV